MHSPLVRHLGRAGSRPEAQERTQNSCWYVLLPKTDEPNHELSNVNYSIPKIWSRDFRSLVVAFLKSSDSLFLVYRRQKQNYQKKN